MEYDVSAKEIRINKVLNELDKFVIEFINILEKHVGYVIVSGYVSILLGRARSSEDVDLLVPEMSTKNFSALFDDLKEKGFECANSSIISEAYEMLDKHAIRFYKGIPVPNMEFKKISEKIHKEAFDNRIKVILKEKVLFISPLELQIAYKLSLMAKGSFEEISADKDFEDAKHLYELFKDKLNKEKLSHFIKLLNVEDKWEHLKNG